MKDKTTDTDLNKIKNWVALVIMVIMITLPIAISMFMVAAWAPVWVVEGTKLTMIGIIAIMIILSQKMQR